MTGSLAPLCLAVAALAPRPGTGASPLGFYPEDFVLAALALFVAGAAAGLVLWRREERAGQVSFLFGAAASLLGLAGFGLCLASGTGPGHAVSLMPAVVPYARFTVALTPLGAFFGIVVSLLGLAVSIYSLGYAKTFHGRKHTGALGALYNGLLLFTTLVFTADNALFFLVSWELMALSAYCLVTFEHEKPEAREAGVFYFVMSHLGTGCLLLGFLLLYQAAGDFSFSSFRNIGERMATGPKTAAFLLFLCGFGVKAGVVPLHPWLPAAHPVAPSNVSATLSGVLIKTGIYGLALVCFEFLGPPAHWWGVTLLVLGTVSGVLGVLYALMQHDLKRLLAYHSIENIGIILTGLGASLLFLSHHHPALAALALAAALYHTINHAVFKALLFLGAGAVAHATGTRDMEHMGGLARRMPWTSFYFLLGAVAISALPPLNGFVSEWLTYQSLLQGYGAVPSLSRLLLPLSGALLALTGALAAACFVKAFGITFLAQPRGEAAAKAREAAPSMLVGQAILAAACVALGLWPSGVFHLLDPVTMAYTGQAPGARMMAAFPSGGVLFGLTPEAGMVSPAGIAAAGLALLTVPAALWAVFGRGSRRRKGPTWDCGLRGLAPSMEYTATGFSKPIRMIFKTLFRPRREMQLEYDYSRYFARTLRFEARVEEVFEQWIYRPARQRALRGARRMRALQAGSLQAYLLYIFLTLLALLAAAL